MNGLFSPIVGMMIQSDELIFSEGLKPPIRYVSHTSDRLYIDMHIQEHE